MTKQSSHESFGAYSSDEQATFEYLYSYYYPKIVYFANQYLLDLEDSKNIAQEVFTELWSKRKNFHIDSNVPGWLFTVTKNKTLKLIKRMQSQENYLDYLRSRQLSVNYKSLSDFDPSGLAYEELQVKIHHALSQLPPVCRKVFEMSRFEGKKNKEIAKELNQSVKTVESHISKALRRLRAELKEYLPLLLVFFLLN